jgi:hypothetical protein
MNANIFYYSVLPALYRRRITFYLRVKTLKKGEIR